MRTSKEKVRLQSQWDSQVKAMIQMIGLSDNVI